MIGRSRTVRIRLGVVLAGAMMGATWAGCSGDFVPPPPSSDSAEAVGSGDAAPTTTASRAPAEVFSTGVAPGRIDLVLSSRVDPDMAAIDVAAARLQAGYDKARLHFWPDPDGTPAGSAAPKKSQAELIRAAIADKPRALIVDPDDPGDKELARAVQDARAARVPVVVVGHPLDGADAKAPGAAPMVVVVPQPFSDSARRLVALSIRNLQVAKVDPAGGAVILASEAGDRLEPDRAAAIREALKAAGIRAVQELRIPRDPKAASATVLKQLQEDRKPVMVFYLDFIGANAARDAAGALGDRHPYVIAGYSADESRTRAAHTGENAGVAEYEPTRLIRKAVSVAAAVAQGRESKAKEEVPISVLESPVGTGLPDIQGYDQKMKEMNKAMDGR